MSESVALADADGATRALAELATSDAASPDADGATRALAELATSDAASPAEEAPKPKATSLFKKKKGKKAFGSKAVLEAPPRRRSRRAPAPAAATSAASFAARAPRRRHRRAEQLLARGARGRAPRRAALRRGLWARRAGRVGPGRGRRRRAAPCLRGVGGEAPSGPNEALRQALASRGGGDLARAFGYADAAEVFEMLVRALDGGGAPGAAAALKTDGYSLVKMPCLICGGDEAPYQPPTSIASVVCVAQDVVRLHAEEPEAAFHDLVRRSRAPEPLSCPVTGERTVAVAARAAAPARVLALNLNWAPTGARRGDVAAVLAARSAPSTRGARSRTAAASPTSGLWSPSSASARTTTRPTYVGGSDGEKLVGFLAASVFSAVYVIAPCYLVAAVARLAQAPLAPSTWLLCLPLVGSMLLPPAVLPPFGMWLLRQYPLRQIPKYFDFEEYAEFTDAEFLRWHEEGKRAVACIHPHGVFPFVSVCGAVSTDIIGIFGIVDAAGKVLSERLKRRKGSCVIYVGGMVELFHSTPKRETVFLKKRKGFVKIALRTGADLIPIYSFGNTTVLEAFKSGPLAA
ncbi:2-acylglycerol O-acyltransferase [Aureococcus anophagefferens]|nr:2-acylglycerol O-acyltransferase [Aureococcus anophagefferens]